MTGFVLPPPKTAAQFFVEVYEVSGGTRRFIDRKAIEKFEATGEFTVTLSRPAGADQRLEVSRAAVLVPGGTIDVQPAPAPAPPAPTAQLGRVAAGDQRVLGEVLPPQGNAAGFFVEVDDVTTPATPRFAGRYAITAFDAAGTFTVNLATPLAAGQRVRVTRGGAELDTVTVPAAVVPKFQLLPIQPGERIVRGVLAPPPKEPRTVVVEIASASKGLKGRKALDQVDAATGAFAVTLDDAVWSGDSIAVAGASGTPATIGPFTARPALRDGLYDGTRIVRGRVDPRPGLAAVRIKVLRSALENTFAATVDDAPIEERYVQMKGAPVNTFSDLGEFAIPLDTVLVAGQVIVAQAVTAAGETGLESERVTVTDPGSWGRARAYFAGGVVFAKDRADFGKQDLALTLAIDKSVLQKTDFTLGAERTVRQAVIQQHHAECQRAQTLLAIRNGEPRDAALIDRACTADARRAAARDVRLRSDGRFVPRQLNSFFDARLTQLPVVEPDAGDNEDAASGSTTTGFRDSRKGAWMQIGSYAPVYGPQTSWVHEGAVNTIFVAPLFRYGIQTISGSGDGTPTRNARGENDDVFHFYGFGFAFGHQKLSGSTNQTPELISYLSVVWGHSEAFEFIDTEADPATDLRPASSWLKCETTKTAVKGKVLVNPCRTMVEGRLKIPNTALQIGFNADLGDGHDDLRFIFGTRFDIGEAFARLRGFDF